MFGFVGYHLGKKQATDDVEKQRGQVVVDFNDDRWEIAIHKRALIQKVMKEGEEQHVSSLKAISFSGTHILNLHQTYRVNLATLQRIRLDQLREDLARLAAHIRFKATEPSGWSAVLREYGSYLLKPNGGGTC